MTQSEETLVFEGYKAKDYAELAWQQLTNDAQYMPMEGDKVAELRHVKQVHWCACTLPGSRGGLPTLCSENGIQR